MRRITISLVFLVFSLSLWSQPEINIPGLSISDPKNTYVIAIGNEDYQTYSDKYTENVMHAIYEAEMFCQMMMHIYNVPKFNVSLYTDAISTKMKVAINKVSALANKSGANAQIIVYYTGRFESDKYGIKSYLIPTDQAEASIDQGIDLDYVYQKLALAKTNNIWLLIDAVKSGKDRDESLVFNGGKPIKITNPEYQGKINALVAKSTDEVMYDQMADVTENETPQASTTVSDNTPPQISLSSPDQSGNMIALDERSVLLVGKVSDQSGVYAVAVNGQEAHLQSDGTFQARIVLAIGPNTVLVEAIDIKNNLAQLKLSIERQEPKEVTPEPEKAPDTDPGVTDEDLDKAKQGPIKGKNYALIIGVNDYSDPSISDLEEPLNDAQKLFNALTTQYLFDAENVKLLKNPGREDIITALDMLEQQITGDDNLVIFYAGHGYWDERVKKGYWFPADASRSNTSNWLRNSTITGYICGINSRHTLVIADACFSGSIFKTRAAFDEAPPSVQRLYKLPSRKAMTSGTLKEVPDRSVFMQYLCKRLTENDEPFISAEELFHSFKPAVLNNSSNIPQYGEIKNAGDEGGQFIFIRR